METVRSAEITRTDQATAEYVEHLETIIGLLRRQLATSESLHKLQSGQSQKTFIEVFSVLTGSRRRRAEVANPSIRLLAAQKLILSHLRSSGDPGVNIVALEEDHHYLQQREGHHRVLRAEDQRVVSSLEQDQEVWRTRGGSSDSERVSSAGYLKPAIKSRADSADHSGQTDSTSRRQRWVPSCASDNQDA